MPQTPGPSGLFAAILSRSDRPADVEQELPPSRAGKQRRAAGEAEPQVETVTLPLKGSVPLEVDRAASTQPVRTAAISEPPLQEIATSIVRGVSVCQLGDHTSLKLEISTPRLSRVGLDLSVRDGRLTARFSVPDLVGRELIRSATKDLESGLGARGVVVEAIEVGPQRDEPARHRGQGHTGQRDNGQRDGDGERGRDRRQRRRPRSGFTL